MASNVGVTVTLNGTQVPKGAVRSDLEVTVEMRYIKVANRRSGEVYLQGKLFREIIPEVRLFARTGLSCLSLKSPMCLDAELVDQVVIPPDFRSLYVTLAAQSEHNNIVKA